MLKKMENLLTMEMSFKMKFYQKIGAIGAVSLLGTSTFAAVPVDFSQLVEQVGPAVVSVNVTKTLSQQEMMQQQVPELLRRFFGHQFQIPQQQTPQKRTGYGSAFFISSDGYLVTNHHVIEDASKVTIVLNDRREFDAEVIGSDERTDVALLKVKVAGERFPALKIGDSNQLKVGEPVLAIGSPFGFDYSASAGIVSAKSRTVSNETTVPFIQSDVALNPGNSGGPLFNQNGEVVGVNSRIFSGTGGYMGLSFSIPVDVAMNVVQQLKEKGSVSRAYLGVMLQEVDRNLADAYKLSKPEGALITQVVDDSPADKAGLKVGDLVLEFNGKKLVRTADLVNHVAHASTTETVDLLVLRDNKRQTLKVKLQPSPDTVQQSKKSQADTKQQIDPNLLGVALRELTSNEKARLKVEGVVVYDIQYDGLAARAGILPNDLITQIGSTKITNLSSFRNAVEKLPQKGTVAVYLQRQNQPLIVGLKLEK